MIDIEINLTGKNILVVEDNETSVFYYTAALKKTNATTIWAKNGREAIDFFKNNGNHIDLVLMDLNMPEMDGFEATRQIKMLNPAVPIIVQSAFILSDEETKSYEAGCDEFLVKPVRLSVLLEVVSKYLS